MLSVEALRQLRAALGEDKVLTDIEDLVCYSFDAAGGLGEHVPGVVVMPSTAGEVQAVVRIADKYSIPVYPRGSATNLSGGALPERGGMVVSLLRMNRILEVDTDNLTATVEPGVIIQDLNDACAPYGLMYPPDPGTVAQATMGGSVAECSGGLRGLKYGVTKHYVLGLSVVLPNGEVARFGGKTVKNVSGYDMVQLFTGSEGTLGIITEITVKLLPLPEFRQTMMAAFLNLDSAGRAVARIIEHRVIPATLEILDNTTIRAVEEYNRCGLPLDAAAILLIEVDGVKEAVEREAPKVMTALLDSGASFVRLAETEREREQLWTARRTALPALSRVRPNMLVEDATVPRSRVPEMLREIGKIAEKYGISIGTMGHAGDGNLHPTILTDISDEQEMARVRQAIDEIYAAALRLGGTLSGEHGIGRTKQKYMEMEFSEAALETMRAVKRALDPKGLMNPGKLVGEVK